MIKNNLLSTEVYEKHFKCIHPSISMDEALLEANRCLFCYDAPCTKRCPTEIDVPKFIKQIASENVKGSAKTILSANIFGAGCSKVCPVEKLCEGSCVYHFKNEKPIAIAALQQYSTEKAIENNWIFFKRKPSVGKKVAVIGAGPSGLSCAHTLSMEGVDITIFEKEKKVGGLVTYGVAAYKNTKEDCEKELNYILSIGGIEIKYNKALGRDIYLSSLMKQYDAVYLAIGVGIPRKLNIPGEGLQGVVNALSFIYQIRTINYSEINIGKNIAVIGMGMTAIDAATQAKKLGAENVTIVYRKSEREISCTEVELQRAKQEGCQIIWNAKPIEILGNEIVEKIVFVNTSASNESFFTLNADMVITAIGQLPFEDLLTMENVKTISGKITTNQNLKTNLKGVFAGGDSINGGQEVVHAVQDGKIAAKSILAFLNT